MCILIDVIKCHGLKAYCYCSKDFKVHIYTNLGLNELNNT